MAIAIASGTELHVSVTFPDRAAASESTRATLAEDGRIGKLIDVQGIVLVKPVMGMRWTPIDRPMPVLPGDWLRTDPRGANAATVRLFPQTAVTLGPGTLAELLQRGRIRLIEGEVKIVASAKAAVELLGPTDDAVRIEATQLYRVEREKLVKVSAEPPWLRYYEGKTNTESIGSLVAKVEGRNVPLSVGFHKVSVDIRDQIARTVIEESFVNHTKATLEGVFYFPLPQEASISGFGMWIGGQLVEADIVERQRAREIYETILRERRDPGLLEWSGGNLFKARVFPIPGNSEKRITISYTQVLPRRGSRYRYQYALQSELLKQYPLRELSIDVRVASAVRLAGVTSPTHPARIDRTAHSAHVEFSAREYTPTRDFEVVFEVDPQQSDVVFIPHRRGDDGYFLVQLTPPGSSGQWQRDILPDGRPIELLILADTSASMDGGSRATQGQLVAALLASLTPKDTFNLAACDVDCRWAFDKPRAADSKNIAAARELLAGRVSLGWSDFDKAFAAAARRAGPKTHVVYVGDGIPTTGDGDPVALAQRLKRLYQGHAGTFHAVAVSASFEPVVLRAIASLGGGSMRHIGSERRPQAVAAELLAEMLQPGLRDLKVEFRGLRTARVYPQELPNLPAGSQQILSGRYLPVGWVSDPSSVGRIANPSYGGEQQAVKVIDAPVGRIGNPSYGGKQQAAEVIVTGTQDGKPVRFTAKVSLAEAEQGNSFIPRLWARMHLDALLAQGASQAVQDDIIALSEQYHIITPYTSLLVLESDADRERFKVKRRFQIRDGEKFFAEGRGNVDYDLVQQQMRRAAGWRVGLRRQALAELARLGRDPEVIDEISRRLLPNRVVSQSQYACAGSPSFGGRGGTKMSAFGVAPFDTQLSLIVSQRQEVHEEVMARVVNGAGAAPLYSLSYFDRRVPEERVDREQELSESGGEGATPEDSLSEGRREDAPERPFGELNQPLAPRASAASGTMADFDSLVALITSTLKPRSWVSLASDARYDSSGDRAGGWETDSDGDGVAGGWLYSPLSSTLVDGLFPNFSTTAIEPKRPESTWPQQARLLARSLLRHQALAGLAGGMEIATQTESFDPRWNELTGRSRTLALVSPSAWLLRSEEDGSDTALDWCDRKERGVLSKAFGLGRLRPSTARELATPPLDLRGFVFSPLDEQYGHVAAEVRPQGGDRTLLRLRLRGRVSPRREPGLGETGPGADDSESPWEMRILIDTARHVVLRIETFSEGKPGVATRFSDFVEVAGAWWAGRIETVDQQGRTESVTVQKFTPLASGAVDQRFQQELAGRERVQFLRMPLPKLAAAKRNLLAGKATFEDRIALMARFERSQQWQRVTEHLRGAERLAAGKPGMRWLRAAAQDRSRLREDWKKGALEEAARLAGPLAPAEQYVLAQHLVAEAYQVLEANERLALLDLVRPVYERQPPHVEAIKQWSWHRIQCLERTGQSQEAITLRRQLAERFPHDVNLQGQYARALAEAGDYEAAYVWLSRALAKDARWNPHEEEQLRDDYARLLREEGRFSELAQWLAASLKRFPEDKSLYRRYLGALVRADRVDEANALAAQWIKEAEQWSRLPKTRVPVSERPGHVRARAGAAIAQILSPAGDDDPFSDPAAGRIELRWLEPLAEAAWTLAQNENSFGLAEQIMDDNHFRATEQARRVRKAAAEQLRAGLDKLAANQVAGCVRWLLAGDPPIEAVDWKALAARLRNRWRAEKDNAEKEAIAEPLRQILSQRLAPDDLLEFLRERAAEAPKGSRVDCAAELFDALVEQPWKAAYEPEAIGLLEQLSDADEPAARLASQVAALHRLTDQFVEARYQAGMKSVEHPEKLTRIELAAKRREKLRAAREGYADQLRQQAPKHSQTLAAWMNVERLYLDVLAGRDLEKAADQCWQFLGREPRRTPDDEEPATLLEEALRQRYRVTLLHVAVRTGTSTRTGLSESGARVSERRDHVQRAVKYLDRAIAIDPEQDRWKLLEVQLLVALDRPKELEAALRAWIEAGDPSNRWGAVLGYLAAEQGRLQEAIESFEAIRARDELGPAEYRALANWHLALGRRQQYERAMVESYKTMDESRLRRWLSANLSPWEHGADDDPFAGPGGETPPPPIGRSLRDRSGASRSDAATWLPGELNPEVPLALTALFEKSSQPQEHLYLLRQFYGATHDFRLLAGLADAVVGHTAGSIYPLLEGSGPVLKEVRDEAAVDSIVGRIAEVRKRATSAVDQRALDLLEVLAERRAAELQDQPGPHGDRAVAAIRRAMRRPWTSGEPRLMADFLAGLEAIAFRPLAEEQIRALEALHRDATNGPEDRLHIARGLANGYAAYQRLDKAIDLLEAALREYGAGQGGVLPMSANDALEGLISSLEKRRHYAQAEKILQEQLKRPANQQQVYWLTERLDMLYVVAVRNDGSVSLGSGAGLYRAVNRRIQAELNEPNDTHRKALVETLLILYAFAKEKHMAGVADDLREFAFKRLPRVLQRQRNEHESIVGSVANVLHHLAGVRDGLAFLIERIEQEPPWLRFSDKNSFGQHGSRLAQWFFELKHLGDLEERLLKIVTAELRRDLESRQRRHDDMYCRDRFAYWAEKTDIFARTAEEVLARHRDFSPTVVYIADYFFAGLDRPARAIEILMDARRRGVLDDRGQHRLAEMLHEQQRFGESIAILELLVGRRPDELSYRTKLMHAYCQTGQQERLSALLEETDACFHKDGRWEENVIAKLASSCLENHLYERSVAYYQEAISLRQRTAPRPGIGDDWLSGYYAEQARAYAGLGKTVEAVDAACAAIVRWGPQRDRSARAVENLQQVLRESRDLGDYVAWLDKESARTGLGNPIVRKALGSVYAAKGEYARAIAQLKLAAEFQPNDAETCRKLVECCEKMGDKEGAIRELLRGTELSRRDVRLYEDLGNRLKALGRHDEAERAYTSAVEMLPNESEGHALLAEICQRENRWADAILQWEQAARTSVLDPTGLLKLAEAQIRERRWDDALRTVRKLKARPWPPRFQGVDRQIEELESKVRARGRSAPPAPGAVDPQKR